MKVRDFVHTHYLHTCISSVQFSCTFISDSLWPHGLQHTRLPGPTPNSGSLLRLMPIKLVMPSNHLILWRPLPYRLQSFPASGSFPTSQFFKSGGQSIGASISASVLPMNIQDWFPCCSRDSQESSPTLQLKSIDSSALSFLYGPNLTSIQDYWRNHSFDCKDLYWQSNVSSF